MKQFFGALAIVFCNYAHAQSADSLEAARSHPFLRAVAAPVVLVSAGFGIQHLDEFYQRNFRRPPGTDQSPDASQIIADYTQYAPIALVYGMALFGNEGEHKVLKKTSLLIQSEILMIAITRPMKILIDKERPDGGRHSFPSGHTAQAFVAATFLHKEYGHKNVWYSIGGYTAASVVGVCRMISNKHWASDVLAGAGIGILSTNLVYRFHKHRKRSDRQITAVPSYNNGPGFYLSMKL